MNFRIPVHGGFDPVVAVCDNHEAADKAVRSLGRAGFDITKVSVIGKGYHTEENALGFYTTGDRIKTWGGIGGLWGGLWGLLAGPSLFLLPRIGLVAAAGPVASALIAALEGAAVVGAISAIGAALISMGIAKDRAIKYQSEIEADRFVILVHGSPPDIEKAKDILSTNLDSDQLPESGG